MNRKVYCSCDSDFTSHFQRQAGAGFSDLTLFQGHPYQRGYGIGSLLKRFGVPILKFLGKQALKTGVNIGNEYLSGTNLRQSIKKQGKAGIRSALEAGIGQLDNILNQSGSGIRKRKRKTKSKRKKPSATKRRKKDIFS